MSWGEKEFEIEDIKKISEFRKSFLDEDSSLRRSYEPDYYFWKYCKNPIQKSEVCLAKDGTEVIGLVAIVPKRLQVLNKIIIGGELSDGFTHKDYQRQGVFSTVLKSSLKKADKEKLQLIYGTPNELALSGERKVGYEVVPSVGLTNMLRPLKIKNILKLKIRNQFISSLISYIPSSIYNSIFRIKKFTKIINDMNIEEISLFDKSIDILSNDVSKDWDIILLRNNEYLNWRFKENPDNYKIFVSREKERILGYMVTKIGTWGKLKIGYIADFLTYENKNIFKTLLSYAFKGFQENKVDMVSCWVCKKTFYYKILLRYGFLPYKNVPIILQEGNNTAKKIIKGEYKWFFTMADSDNI